MHLDRALDVHEGESLAFVGAGGKSSTLFALAREVKYPVIITTTTHLGAWQTDQVDRHIIMEGVHDFQQLDFSPDRIILLTGSEGEDQRLSALQPDVLNLVHTYCRKEGVLLLIEADGASQLPLKAPAPYEPVIPEWVDKVVTVAGMGGLGKPLTPEYVHRPARFAAVSGLPAGEKIGVSDLVSVLRSEQGGLQGVSADAYRILFLNQAETHDLSSKALRAAMSLTDHYQRVLIGSAIQMDQNAMVQSVHSRVAGVLLAAGGSERLGRPKQLLAWEGKPFIHKVAENALEAGLKPLVAVLGAEHEAVEKALDGLAVQVVHNPDWALGQATSMQAGLVALPRNCEGAMFLLCDQPQISVILIRQILERFAQNRAAITAPLIQSQRGNPVLFSREAFSSLGQVEGDQGGRAIFNQFKVDWLPWIDDRAGFDVDDLKDYQRMLTAHFPRVRGISNG